MKLPAGLTDNNIEVFASGNEVMATYDGKIIPFTSLPTDVKEIFFQEMLKDTDSIKEFVRQNITDETQMLNQWTWCNFGGWNEFPDYENGKFSIDFWDCGRRNECPFKTKLCKGMKINDESCSKRELEIIQFIGRGKLDKEIAKDLCISVHTVTTHRQRIENKFGFKTKVDIAVFCAKQNLI